MFLLISWPICKHTYLYQWADEKQLGTLLNCVKFQYGKKCNSPDEYNELNRNLFSNTCFAGLCSLIFYCEKN